MRIFFILILSLFLSACLGKRAAEAERNYAVSYGGYLASQADCMSENKNKVEVPQIQGDPIKIEFAAGDCNDINKPQHGGEYVAKSETALINTGGALLGTALQVGYGYKTAKDNNDTRVELAEIENEVLITAIESSQQSAQAASDAAIAVAEQSTRVTELVLALTQEIVDDEDEEDEEGFGDEPVE